ncbi:ATP-binding cassette domain-containing protein [Thalassovita aquimarina]|uniref:ATP-binding cassette domain-containing protein n=1 Tax=Thalassovita aquimarina TaxID=2785917 RepID=A0ABS5HL13_9RHOB|nr:ATP-binding cassette domain-containing protein [Thalassovita aquimarina]MBR9649526.1 ATP-binding cassette domain-containing protein [Thalassovita aquimarina]
MVSWLSAEGLSVRRGGRTLMGPVSFDLTGDGIAVVMGPNGAGKTTLLRALHGLERRRGDVRWGDAGLAAGRNQAFVFQSPVLMRRTVLDCIAFPLRLDGVARAEARARAEVQATRVGLRVDLGGAVEDISGGEKQKMAMARALIRDPGIMFLDEPCANLDGRSTCEIEDILTQIRDSGTRIMMSTHDIGQARRLAGEVLFLHQGKLEEQGIGDTFFDAPKSKAATAYLRGDILL